MRMYDFKYKLLETVNQSGLTIEEVYYIWKELFEEITANYNNLLVKEQQEKDKQENSQDIKEIKENEE